MNHRAGRPHGRPDPHDTVAEWRGARLQSAYTAVRVCPVSLLAWRRSGIRGRGFPIAQIPEGVRCRGRNCLTIGAVPAVGFRDAPTPCRGDPEDPRARSQGGAERGLGLRSGDRTMAAPPGLPRHRGAEGGDDRALRLPPLASRDHRAVVEGGELLRPALVARRAVVSRPVPPPPERQAGRRGEPQLPLPPARTRAGSSRGPEREARRPPPRTPSSGRTPSTSTRSRSAASRSRSRTRWQRRTTGRAARSSACSQIRAPSAAPGGTTPTPRAGSTPNSSSDGSRSSRVSSSSSSRPTSWGRGRARRTRRSSPSSERRRTSSTTTPACSTVTTRRWSRTRGPPSRPASPSRTGGSRRCSADRSAGAPRRARQLALRLARRLPDVDVAVGRVAVDLGQLVVA